MVRKHRAESIWQRQKVPDVTYPFPSLPFTAMHIRLTVMTEPPQSSALLDELAEYMDSYVLRGERDGHLLVQAEHVDSPAGQHLLHSTRTLGIAPPHASVVHAAAYSEQDLETAELLFLSPGGAPGAVDKSSLKAKKRCLTCGRLMVRDKIDGGAQLTSVADVYDLFYDQRMTFISAELAAALADTSGLDLRHTNGPFLEVSVTNDIGLPSTGRWHSPCDRCGRSRVEPREPVINGWMPFERTNWGGADWTSPANRIGRTFFVSQAVRSILTDPRWRHPKNGPGYTPIAWVSGGQSGTDVLQKGRRSVPFEPASHLEGEQR